MNKIQSSTQKWIQKGRRVWIKATNQYPNPFQDAFLEGTIVDIQKNQHARVLLADSKQEFKIPFDDCLKLTYGPKDVADMVDLQQLNQPQLLFNIKRRYVQDSIFTYCGPTLLIINPYMKIQRLFNDSVLQEYQSYVFTDTLQYKNISPHIFGLAAFCLWQLFDNQRNQSIVISGESGAGKTENTKYCLKFLASLGKNMKQLINESQSLGGSMRKSKMGNNNLRAAQKAIKKTSSKVYGMQEKILGCNQILQAFGNSKTIRNDNSSRFGKLILLVYGQTQIEIKSAFIISYLLQKSRIVSVSQGERNYHIFYYFIKGTSVQQKKKYQLHDTVEKYYYLNQSTVTNIPGMLDQQKFEQIKRQFAMYLTEQQIQTVLSILSVVLNLGNIKFSKSETSNNQQTAIIDNNQYLKIISELLKVQYPQLLHSFQFKTRKLGTSVINSPLKYEEALSLRDSFSKNIYQKTFNFLIKKLNQKIQIQQISFDDEKGANSYRKSIGILDIFGFEVLTINSLQQFFINFANEKLQQLYVSYIFKEQQNEFMREGLREFSHDIGFQDNKPIIDLFQNYPLGIFHLVNQSSELNQDDKDLPSSVEKNHSKNMFLKIPKSKRSCFQIIHSCSPVSYNTNGFTSKNKDQFPVQLLEIIQRSKSVQIQKICVGQPERQSDSKQKGGRNAAKKFLGSKFLNQMNKLIEELYSCDCHFVRCIKPNSKKSPKLFNSYAVLQSLRYLGVLDSIIIRKLGYIYRRPFKQFYKKFYQLDHYVFSYHEDAKKHKTEEDFKKQSQRIINKYARGQLEENNILLGHKKILIKQSTLNHLELLTKEKRKLRINAANRFKTMYKNAVFRSKVKTFLARLKVMKTHMKLLVRDIKQKIVTEKIIKIQNVVKKFLWQKRFEKIKQEATKSVTKISAYFKMKKQRNEYLNTKRKILEVQSIVRSFLDIGKQLRYRNCWRVVKQLIDRSWMNIVNKKVIMIQKTWKGYHIRNKFKKVIDEMKRNLKLAKIKAKFKRAIFTYKYLKFKQALNKYKRPIIKLQAIVRGKFHHQIYNKVKKSSLLIQKAYRRHLKKKFYLEKEWSEYKRTIMVAQTQKYKLLQSLNFPLSILRSMERQIDQTNALRKIVSPKEMMYNYVFGDSKFSIKQTNFAQTKLKINETIYFAQKNTFELYVMDYDSLLVNQKELSIVERFAKLKQNVQIKGEYLIFIDLTENHLVAVSNKQKIYRVNIKGRINFQETASVGTLKKIQSTNLGSLTYLYQQNKCYEWGIIKQNNTDNIINKINIPITEGLNEKQIILSSSKGMNQYFVCSSKNMIQRKYVFRQQNIRIIKLSQKVQIQQIACSYHFVHFLTQTGILFSMGHNKKGELGLGFVSLQVKQPLNNNLIKKMKQSVEQVSVGMGHTVIKTRLGYAYAWGQNSFSQVGAKQVIICKPYKIPIDQKNTKVLQVSAGMRSSYLLTENLKIYLLGSPLGFQYKQSTVLHQITQLQQSLNISRFINFIKLRCLWTRQQSILFVNGIDFSRCKQGVKPEALNKYTKVIAKQWIQNTIYPPYHEFLDNGLNLSDLRKLKFKVKNDKNDGKKESKKIDQIDNIENLKMFLELGKNSSIFKQAAKVKIQEFMNKISKKTHQQWTTQETQVFQMIMKQYKGR